MGTRIEGGMLVITGDLIWIGKYNWRGTFTTVCIRPQTAGAYEAVFQDNGGEWRQLSWSFTKEGAIQDALFDIRLNEGTVHSKYADWS